MVSKGTSSLSHSPTKTDIRLKTVVIAAALCATLAGMLRLFAFAARHGADAGVVEGATYLLCGLVTSGMIAIAFRCSSYAMILLISQAMMAVILLVDTDFADPNGHVIVGLSCVAMIAGLLTAVGHTIFQAVEKWTRSETGAVPTPPSPSPPA